MVERRDRLVVVPYDDDWPVSFAEQCELVTPLLAPILTRPVEHIGSTSVPGLPAKPIVDMLAVVTSSRDVAPLVTRLNDVGWLHAPEPEDAEGRRWSFCHPTVAHRTHHLHVVEETSQRRRTWVRFRDHLCATPADRDEYAAIKTRLASIDDRDRVAYRAGKAPFIERVLAELRTEPDSG